MGWLRVVGSLILYISFAEHCLFYRALLQRRPIILKSLLIVATPYQISPQFWYLFSNIIRRYPDAKFMKPIKYRSEQFLCFCGSMYTAIHCSTLQHTLSRSSPLNTPQNSFCAESVSPCSLQFVHSCRECVRMCIVCV